jgi:hypothetical protein
MNKKLTLLIALFSFFLITKGQVLHDETFNYSVSNLAQEPTWTTGGTTPPVVGSGWNIVTPSLTYITTAGTYVLSDLGKTINSQYISGAANWFSFKEFTETPVTSTIYLTFMFQAGVAQKQSQAEIFGLGDSVGTGPKLWAGKGIVTTTNYRLGTTRVSTTGADIKWGATEFSDTLAVHLVVIKYDFGTQTSSLFIDPALGSVTEPTPDAIDNTAGTPKTKLSSLRFRYNGNNKANFNLGGARVSSSWANAVARVSMAGLSDQIQEKNDFIIYQNPSSKNLKFDYRLTESSDVNLVLYNINGQAVKVLINYNNQTAGSYSESFDVSGLKTGIYLARFTSLGVVKSSKILINQ